MYSLVLLSPKAGSGKTTVAAMLAEKLGGGTLTRLGDDTNAATDRELFRRLSRDGDSTIAEAPGGESGAATESRAIVVADGREDVVGLIEFCSWVGSRMLGIVLNRVPERRRQQVVDALSGSGTRILVDLPEDRSLATPSLDDVTTTLNAKALFFDSNGERPLDGVVIASISADPGQGYFAMREAKAVIVRSDKPDLQLAALNAGASCLIVTGELPLLGYVQERAEADEIPIIRTALDTVSAVRNVETLYGTAPFSGTPAKLSRLAELTQGFDATPLLVA